MQRFLYYSCALFLAFFTWSCEDPYQPDSVYEGAQMVVEGYVQYDYLEQGNALPPYVILTRNLPYQEQLDTGTLNSLFIHNADVRVVQGNDTVQLIEICYNDLAALGLQDVVADALGLGDADSNTINLCVYTDFQAFFGNPQLPIIVGAQYDLYIESELGQAQASTSIPPPVPLDSVFWLPHPDPSKDSLVEVRAVVNDPANEANYYRLFTQRNDEPMYPNGLGQSVIDDPVFNGQRFEFPIQRGQAATDDVDVEDVDIFGYFWRGDTVTIRGSTLPYEHFRFWQTTEYNFGSQGPFGTYVRVDSNVEGALGLWGGISFGDYRLIIPE